MTVLVAWALDLVVAAALLVAAVGKIQDPGGFTRMLGGALPRRLEPLVPVQELLLAVGLAQPWRPLRELTALVTLGVFGGFTAFLIANPRLDADGGCRCFGPLVMTRRVAVLRNVALIGILCLALALSPSAQDLGPLGWAVAVGAAALLVAGGYLVAGFIVTGFGRTAHAPAAALAALADPHRQTMVVFLAPGCTSCARIRALLPGWQADGQAQGEADGGSPRVVVLEDDESLDRFAVTVTPSAVVLDSRGRAVDPNGMPSQAWALGPDAVETRYRLAVQGHDLPIAHGADRTLMVFLRRGDQLPDLPAEPGLEVVVLAPHRLRPALDLPVTLDPDNRLALLFGIAETPSAVLLDGRGHRLSPVGAGATGIATLLHRGQPTNPS